jgi:hypothetical protein
MFENMRMRWHEARAARLKEEYLDASRRTNGFTEENSEHFFKTLDYASRYWVAHHGPVKECSIEFRKSAAKELKARAKRHLTSNIGNAYGLAVFSFHVEASFLPGEDASFVYDLTALTISKASGLVQKVTKPT